MKRTIADILNSKYQAETKIDDIYQEIRYSNLEYPADFWIKSPLPKSVNNFLLVYEWISFEDYESYKVALSLVYSELMFDVLEKELQLIEIAETLRKARNAIETVRRQTTNANLETGLKQKNKLRISQEFSDYEKYYYAQKPVIFERLLNYVANNIGDFP